ncbi:OPT/YSL family transporter [Streptomonospora nanhaiensis]|uniref:Putative oligopeptide transporter (OPT) family protein n=1 Tax=Streptomonospora nanhaiensis TaxID=1323731 RepID=A0A853BV25_9ACTN|nr:OPT/YSL family transporter [Streptomonospora nanhaiensis]MBV2366521.1 OPT/YSL family transporter [Streptomonospora nanhaiensis]MBX9391483.1 OPT/YSL family transporter [Streptomonospora nanhaiensis]NYI98367.1 putative oligopeptide transporter (OPT) family protein [Streptomonospora nanhaiensis]
MEPSAPGSAAEPQTSESARHPRAFEPVVVIATVLVSLLGAVIGIHMITTLGVSPNTSVIGAVIAMLIGRIGFLGMRSFRNTNRQNLLQSSISGATFAAANSLLTPIAIPFLFGRPDLVWPMLLGASLGLLIDVWVLYKAFGSRFLPADAAWPPGVAAAETIKAGDRGGRQAAILVGSGVFGLGASFLGMPMSAAGIAMIGNVWALLMFAVGLLVAQYSPAVIGVDLNAVYVPHGVMIGAGVVALAQIVVILAGRQSRRETEREAARERAAQDDPSLAYTVSRATLGRALGSGYALFALGALVLAVAGGIWSDMSWLGIIGFVLFAAVAALVHELIVGLAAMHAGWFPAFAVTLIFLILGLALGIPGVPLALLVGYCAATGPAFADMGYDFKAGWILRRDRRPYTAFELDGRRQQLFSSMIGFAVAIGMVALLWQGLFEEGAVPPTSIVYADTIEAGLTDPSVLLQLALWAVPGALVQLLGGPRRQMGVLLATGLLVATPNAGWLVLAGLAVRLVWQRRRGEKGEQEISLVGAGLIAGDSVHSVGTIFSR